MSREDPFVDLRDEDRSTDGDDTGGSLHDFIVNDDLPPVETQLPSQGPGSSHPRALTPLVDVSIFNTFGRALATGGNEQAEHAERNSGRIDPSVDGPTRSGAMSQDEMKVTDLSSYQGTTITDHSQPDSFPRLAGGEDTKVEGFDNPGRMEGLMTQGPIQTAATRTLKDERPAARRETEQWPRSSIHGGTLPHTSEGLLKGDVAMDWESEEEEWDNTTPQQAGIAEGERLARGAHEAWQKMKEALQLAKDSREAWMRHLWTTGERATVEKREEVMVELFNRGDMWGLLLMKAEVQDTLRISPLDIMEARLANWEAEWGNFKDSKKTSFNKPEVLSVLQRASALQDHMDSTLDSWMGTAAWKEFRNRHRELIEGLKSGRSVSARTAKLFPRDKAGAIMEWYTRWTAGLTAMHEHTEALDSARNRMLRFLEEYPGPDLEKLGFEGRMHAYGLPVVPGGDRSGSHHTVPPVQPSARSGFDHTSKTAHKPMTYMGDSHLASHPSQRRVVSETQMLGTSASASRLPERQLPYGEGNELNREELRSRAVEGGYFYRQFPTGGDHQQVNALGPEMVKYQRQSLDVGNDLDSPRNSYQSRGDDSVLTGESSLDDLSGFTGMSRTDIEAEVRSLSLIHI